MNKENDIEGSNLPIHQHYFLLLKRFETLTDNLSKLKREEFKLKTEISQFLETPLKLDSSGIDKFNLKKNYSHIDVDFESYLKKIASLENVIIIL